MRKIYTTLLSVILFSFFLTDSNAQVNEYVFTHSSGTYTPLAGGTVSTAAGDDGTQGAIPINFTLMVDGNAYTHVALTTNGFIRLGTAGISISTGSDNFDNSNFGDAANAPLIAPFWDDNNATGATISYITEGSAPNRTFSVEWKDLHIGNGGNSSAPTGTFKVTLTETLNTITIQYGTINTLVGASGSIGLNDATSFLSIMPGTPPTSSIITPTNNISSAVDLGSGTTYMFTPPPPCVPGTLAGGTTQSTVTNACSGVSFTLSVTGSSFGNGITYEWESSPDGSTWTAIPSATGISHTLTQSASTWYRRKISCSGGPDAWSSPLQIIQNSFLACYCTPAFPSNVEPITSVIFAGINNTSDATVGANPELEDFTSITGNVAKGSSYQMRVSGNTDGPFTSHINIYVDWNQDGDFTDPDESYYIGSINNSTGEDGIEAAGNILVPATAHNGNTLMRVIKKYNTQGTACNTTGFGQAEDYTLNVTTPPCFAPSAISVSGISTTTVTVSFTASGTPYVEYGPLGFTPGTGAAAGTGGNVISGASPVTLTGLTPGATYDVYVRQDCGAGVFGSNGVGGSFTTLCSAVNIPYTQDFESATPPVGLPECMTIEDVNGNSGPDLNVTGGRWVTYTTTNTQITVSPTKGIRYIYDADDVSRGADDWFYLRGLNLTAGTNYRLKFYYKASNGPDFIEALEVKYGTAPASGSMTNTIYTNTNIATSINDPFDSARVDFSPTVTGVYYIGFHAMSDPDQAVLVIDDISVRNAPVIDMSTIGFTGAPVCPATSGVLKATIRNDNINTHAFATYPITVTATITGTATGTISTTINSGTLAAGEVMTVDLPAFNYAGGYYNVTVATSSSFDTETSNDSYSSSFFVNPNPPVATITPAAPQVCVGGIVQLNTQFTTTPPAPVTMSPVSSGTISLPIPDGSTAGVTSTLAVTGVPIGSVITNVSVTLNATHTFNGDLVFNLKAPNGKIINLVAERGGGGDNITNLTISAAATAVIPAGTLSPMTGSYADDGVVGIGAAGFVSDTTAFEGLFSVPNGNWTLIASDNIEDDAGTLTSWSITITYATPHPLVTWSPATGLFTNAAATIAYVPGANAFTVYAKPATTATYTVTTTGPGGCLRTATTTVNVNEPPVVNVAALTSKICKSDGPIALTATPSGGVWSGIGVSGSSFIPTLATAGTYTLTYTFTSTQGCSGTATATAKVEECPERVRLLRDQGVIVYPNPNNGQFNFRVNTTLYNKLSLRVYTSTGLLVRSMEFSDLAYNRIIPLDFRQLPSGVYLVSFSYRNGDKWDEKTYNVMIGH